MMHTVPPYLAKLSPSKIRRPGCRWGRRRRVADAKSSYRRVICELLDNLGTRIDLEKPRLNPLTVGRAKLLLSLNFTVRYERSFFPLYLLFFIGRSLFIYFIHIRDNVFHKIYYLQMYTEVILEIVRKRE